MRKLGEHIKRDPYHCYIIVTLVHLMWYFRLSRANIKTMAQTDYYATLYTIIYNKQFKTLSLMLQTYLYFHRPRRIEKESALSLNHLYTLQYCVPFLKLPLASCY